MRIAPLLPLLLPSFALPAAAGEISICLTAAQSVSCLIEQAEFEYARNAEINASIARVQRVRAFEAARNAEINASIARVEARRQRQLEAQQNALINASIAAANAERERRFAAAQNEIATASVERVAAVRQRQLALSTTHCKTRFSRTPRCLAEREERFARRQNALAAASIERVKAERERAFAAARNAEINASIAAVERNRVALQFAADTSRCAQNAPSPRCEAERARELQASLTHCNSTDDTRPRCVVERNREFHLARNAEINASIAAVERNRAAADYSRMETATICQPYNWLTASCRTGGNRKQAAQRGAEYAALTSYCVRNPESPRCEAERIREFAAARNAEINASIAAVQRARASQQAAAQGAGEYAELTSQCVRNPESPRCEAERIREFAAARNAEINASIAAVQRARAGRGNNQQAASMGAGEYAALTSHCARNPERPRCDAERIREFAAARNAEINASIAAVERARAAEATGSTITRGNGTGPDTDTPAYGGNSTLETGALGVPAPMSSETNERNDLRNNISIEPCRRSGTPFGPLHFIQGAEIEEGMKPELDRLVSLAQACPGMRIEVHGYSDGTGSAFTNRSMAQARAQAIADYLIAAGIAPNRLATIGRGAAADWVLPYSKGVDRAFGRRVEFIIKDPAMDAAARRVMYDLAELLDPTYVPAVADLGP